MVIYIYILLPYTIDWKEACDHCHQLLLSSLINGKLIDVHPPFNTNHFTDIFIFSFRSLFSIFGFINDYHLMNKTNENELIKTHKKTLGRDKFKYDHFFVCYQ